MRTLPMLFFVGTLVSSSLHAAEPTHDVQSNGYITKWLLCGPFPNPGSSVPADSVTRTGFHIDFLAGIGGETGCKPTAGLAVEHDGTTCVFTVDTASTTYLDLLSVFRKEYAVAYAYTTLVSSVETPAYMHMGADDGLKVFVNGEMVYEHFATRGMREHDDVFEVKLRKGENALLIKVDQGHGGWSVVARLLDRPGHAEWVKTEVVSTATARLEQDGVLGSTLTLFAETGLASFGVIDEAAVRWQLLGPGGDSVATAEGTFTKPARLTLPAVAGFYTVRMHSPSLGITREAMCLLSKNAARHLAGIAAEADTWLTASPYPVFAGMIAYRLALLQEAITIEGASSSQAITCAGMLRRYLDAAGTDTLAGMRGAFEWAYRSKVDKTGQPFTLRVPSQYDSSKPWPLHIHLHGNGGTHNPPGPGENLPHTEPYLYLTPLGRARGGGYDKLSEVDVMEAIEYVRAQWNIDPRQIHLSGGSMGGGGTFRLAARHPHLFASAVSVCGYGLSEPMDNMQHVPVYSYHSTDDWVVPVIMSRLPMQRLANLAGCAIQDEVSGYGHGVWQCKDCDMRSWVWRGKQVRPAEVRTISYTAIDGFARGAYWAHIAQWGPNPDEARFDVRLGADNGLYLTVRNVGILHIDLAASPADRARNMSIVFAGTLDTILTAPLPDTLLLSITPNGCRIVNPVSPSVRRHFPGGLPAMLHDEPLMIVYGTKGNARTDSLLKAIADMMKYTVRGQFAVENPGQRHNTMHSGMIPCKSDREVSAEDIAGRNLIIIGTAEQNSLVARIAKHLPVQIVDGRVTTNDGPSWSFKERCLGLLYYNPLAPHRLLYWIAADRSTSIESGRAIFDIQMWTPTGPDLIIAADSGDVRVAHRYFAPDWSWQKGYADSPPVPASLYTSASRSRLRAEALRVATNADFVLPDGDVDGSLVDISPGETRLMDMRARSGGIPPVMFTLRGDTLLAHTSGDNATLSLYPRPDSASIVPDRLYSVATASGWSLADYTRSVQWTPDSSWYVDVDAHGAYDRIVGRMK